MTVVRPRRLRIPRLADRRTGEYIDAYRVESVTFATSIALTKAQLNAKEVLLLIGALTNNLALSVAVKGFSKSEHLDVLHLRLEASGAARTVTFDSTYFEGVSTLELDTGEVTIASFVWTGTKFTFAGASGLVSASGASVGTAGTNVTAEHQESAGRFKTVLTLDEVEFTISGAGSHAVGALIYTFPAGDFVVDALAISLSLQGGGVVDADTPDVGLGSVIATGAVALLSGTPTFEDYFTGQTFADVDGTASDVALLAVSPAGERLVLAASAHTLHLNIADGWAGADTILASGTVTIFWKKLT